MTPASLSEIAKATGGQLSGKDVPVTGYSTDTRSIKSGDCLLYTSPSPRDRTRSRMPSSA